MEQKKAAIDAERLTSRRSNSPVLERQNLRSKRIEDLMKSKKEKLSQLESIKDNPEEYEQAKDFIIRNINEYKSNNPDASAVMDSLLKKI